MIDLVFSTTSKYPVSNSKNVLKWERFHLRSELTDKIIKHMGTKSGQN